MTNRVKICFSRSDLNYTFALKDYPNAEVESVVIEQDPLTMSVVFVGEDFPDKWTHDVWSNGSAPKHLDGESHIIPKAELKFNPVGYVWHNSVDGKRWICID